jgi:hypothetical protein
MNRHDSPAARPSTLLGRQHLNRRRLLGGGLGLAATATLARSGGTPSLAAARAVQEGAKGGRW